MPDGLIFIADGLFVMARSAPPMVTDSAPYPIMFMPFDAMEVSTASSMTLITQTLRNEVTRRVFI
jgi:hypothetical protein